MAEVELGANRNGLPGRAATNVRDLALNPSICLLEVSGTTYSGTTSRPMGSFWAHGTGKFNFVSTIMPPNGPSCVLNDDHDSRNGIYAASSRHPNIVLASMADGAVKAFKDDIDIRTWQGLGTRSGEESLGEF